jgi:hypothetical protein
MNEIAKRNGTDVTTSTKNPFEQYSEAVGANRIVGDLLKFSKGEYLAGRDGVEVPEGTEMVAILDELLVGWLKWENNKPADMRMGKVSDGFLPMRRAELGDDDKDNWETDDRGDRRDPWQLTNVLILKALEGEKLYTFATSSKGGMGAIGKLCGAYGKHMRSKPGEFPVVSLQVDSYKHPNKSYGKIFTPLLEIVGWVDKGESLAALAGEMAAEKQEAVEADADAPFEAAPTVKKGPQPHAGYKDKASPGSVKARF